MPDADGVDAGVATHCPYCALQCGMSVQGAKTTPREFPTNRGGLCQKGWTAGELLSPARRLTSPLVRIAGELREVDWDEALDVVATRLLDLRERHGADSVAVFGGGGLTNEKAYLLGKFARVALGTAQVDYNGRYCMSSAAAGGIAAFGVDRGLPFPVTDLDDADVILLAGANVAETMPPLMGHLTGAKLIVVDPRRSATADVAALHLQPAPGTDLALALGLLHVAATEGVLAKEYIDDRTNGFDAVWRIVAGWWPERVERVTGVSVADQRLCVRMLADAQNSYVLTGRGTEQHANGTATVSAWINLCLALGLPGTPGSGFGCLTGQGNGQGGREHGQKADQLPGYRKIDDPAAREHVARVWDVPADSLPGPGRSAYELMTALGTDAGPKALLLFGSNPVVSAPNAGHVTDRLGTLDLLVVADLVLSDTAARADVVLPVTQWAEEDGTMTNLEGRILLRQRALRPPDGVRSDLEVLRDLAIRLGQPEQRFPADPVEVFAELGRASAGGVADYAGVTYERLRRGDALHWPVPSTDHPGTPRLFGDRFGHPDGRARFVEVDFTGHAEPVDAEFPLHATTGRVLTQYQSGAQTRRVPELNSVAPEVFVEIHPDTATRSGLTDGGLAVVSSRRGRVRARVRFVKSIRWDVVFLPFHFPGVQRANLLTNPALDPTSRMPEFKTCAVRVEAL